MEIEATKSLILSLLSARNGEDLGNVQFPEILKKKQPTNFLFFEMLQGREDNFRSDLLKFVLSILKTDIYRIVENKDFKFPYLKEFNTFCVCVHEIEGKKLKDEVRDILFNTFFDEVNGWDYVEQYDKYSFFKVCESFHSTTEELSIILDRLIDICFQWNQFEEVVEYYSSKKELMKGNKEEVLKVYQGLLDAYERMGSVKQKEQKNDEISIDEKIVNLVLEMVNEPNLLNEHEKNSLMRTYSSKYKDRKELQERIPSHEASQNYCEKAFGYMKNEDFEKAEKLFDLAIQKDKLNQNAFEGKRSLLKKKLFATNNEKEQNSSSSIANSKKELARLSYNIFEKFNVELGKEDKVSLMKDVLTCFQKEKKDEEKDEEKDLSEFNIPINVCAFQYLEMFETKSELAMMKKRMNEMFDTFSKENHILKNRVEELSQKSHDLEEHNEDLKIRMLQLSKGKKERRLVYLDCRHGSCFYICGLRWEIKMIRSQFNRSKSDVWLFHDIRDRVVSLVDSFIRIIDNGKVVQEMKLDAPIGKNGWRCFEVATNIEKLKIDISMSISHELDNKVSRFAHFDKVNLD